MRLYRHFIMITLFSLNGNALGVEVYDGPDLRIRNMEDTKNSYVKTESFEEVNDTKIQFVPVEHDRPVGRVPSGQSNSGDNDLQSMKYNSNVDPMEYDPFQ